MSTISSVERATVQENGYMVVRDGRGWRLRHAESDAGVGPSYRGWLMIGDHGTLSPTEWEAYAEALRRITSDARIDAGPRFDHDCDACTFVGRVGRADVYSCPNSGGMVARLSSEPSDYHSGEAVDLDYCRTRFDHTTTTRNTDR